MGEVRVVELGIGNNTPIVEVHQDKYGFIKVEDVLIKLGYKYNYTGIKLLDKIIERDINNNYIFNPCRTKFRVEKR